MKLMDDTMTERPIRTWLFAPGMDQRKIDKALASKADAVILDLEDAVAISEKPRARDMVRALLAQVSTDRRVYVRLNDLTTGLTFDDLDAACIGGVAGVLLTKVETPAMVHEVSARIDALSVERGIAAGQIRMAALIETARGVLNASVTAGAGARLDTLVFGAGDFTGDLGIPTANVGPHILNAKVQVALASRAAGLARPVDAVFFDVTDAGGYEADCVEGKALGYQGKAVIHPNQIDVANAVYSPSLGEIEGARRVAEAFKQAEAAGVGAIRVEGKLVDYAMVKNAETVLATARALDLI